MLQFRHLNSYFFPQVSPFDEKLAEDKHVNRLEDSFLLWRSVSACKILERTHIILFLNKCDLLQAKLQRGVRIRDSVPSYGEKKNDFATAAKCQFFFFYSPLLLILSSSFSHFVDFQHHFKEIFRGASPIQRPFYAHLTSVIDTRATAITLGTVEEIILREHLRHANLM